MNHEIKRLVLPVLIAASSFSFGAEIKVVPTSEGDEVKPGMELVKPVAEKPALPVPKETAGSQTAAPVDPVSVEPTTQSSPNSVEEPNQAMLVLDASGSMWGKIGSRTKIGIAREVVGEVLGNWDAATHLGLMAYGHRSKGECTDIETLLPPAAVDAPTFRAAVDALVPKGKTPLTQAVLNAAQTLKYTEAKATVILISDGRETCGIDPCAAAAELNRLGVDFTTHVVSFDVPEPDTKGLRCLAETTGGLFLNARDAVQLKAALNEITIATVEPPPAAVSATVEAPAEVVAGAEFPVTWTGPKERFDRLIIVKPNNPEEVSKKYIHQKSVESPAGIKAPETPGDYLLHYYSRDREEVLATANIRVLAAAASISAPASVMAGSDFPVEWQGPKNQFDRVAVFTADGRKQLHGRQVHRRDVESPTYLEAPELTGQYLVRYYTRGKNTLAQTQVEVTEAIATITAPNKVLPSARFEVLWEGPSNVRDRLQVVSVQTGEVVESRTIHNRRPPLRLKAPEQVGDYQLRYLAYGTRTLVTVPIAVRAYQPPAATPEG